MEKIVIFTLLIVGAAASHFRGGIISVSPLNTENKTMVITFRVSYRRNHVYAGRCNQAVVDGGKEVGRHPENQGIFCVSGCPKKELVSLIRYVCTDFSTTDNWEYGERTLGYSFVNVTTIRLSATGCCWVAPFGNGAWDLFTIINLSVRPDTGRINSSPQARFFPVIPIQEGCNSTIAIRPYDPDGDIVRCRWGNRTTQECSGICDGFPGAVLNEETCTLSYQSIGRDRGFKAVALMMEDFSKSDTRFQTPLSTVALNFLVNVYRSGLNCTAALPEYVPPTPLDGACIAIPRGTTYNGSIIIDTHASTVSVNEVKTVGPVGVNKGRLTQIASTTQTYVNITWKPQQSDYFENNNKIESICFSAVVSTGQSTVERCIQWMAGISPPRVIPMLARNAAVSPLNPSFEVTFDQNVVRPKRGAKLKISDVLLNREVYSIEYGKERGRESIVIMNSNQVLVSTDFRFDEKRNFSVEIETGFVEGVTGCGPLSEAFPKSEPWLFETLDITPPRIIFLQAPRRSGRTITIGWTTNEPLKNSSCFISTYSGDPLKQYSCSGTEWTGSNLREGRYSIHVNATDIAGNRASRTHTWNVDLTPPEVAISAPFEGDNSNLRRVQFQFKCPGKPSCTYQCVLENNTAGSIPVNCLGGEFLFDSVTHEGKYRLIVRAIDDVGNAGKNFTFTWTADFTPPTISNIFDSIGKCDGDLSPTNNSKPTASDSYDPSPVLTYKDSGSRSQCQITRVWTAADSAGNTVKSHQTITLTYQPAINLLPELRLPCDPSVPITVPNNTANADNPCSRSVTLTFTDSATSITCPSQMERTWSAKDNCDQSLAPEVRTQLISFYSICPASACGRTSQPPQGTCIEGNCLCNKPWSGADCNIQVYEPILKPIVRQIVLREAEMYIERIMLLQGTEPIYYELFDAPAGMEFNQRTGRIEWQANTVGNTRLTVKAINGAGVDSISWNISVTAGYVAELNQLQQDIFTSAQPIRLSGKVDYKTGNLVESTYSGEVPVEVHILLAGTSRKYQTVSRPDGSFSLVFEPLRTEYGSYQAKSSHPGISSTLSGVEWKILGMRFRKPVATVDDESLSNINKLYLNRSELINDGPGTLTDVKVVSVVNLPDNIRVELLFDQENTIPVFQQGAKVPINVKIISDKPFGKIRALFRVSSAEGVSVNFILNADISHARPAFMVQPRDIRVSVARGSQVIVQLNITNVGRADATEVNVNVPNIRYISVISFGNSSYSTDKQVIFVGQTILLVLQFSASDDSQLGRYTGSIGLEAQEIQEVIPLDLKVISDEKATVTFRVEDEFTYFADTAPLVENARIRIYNNIRGITFMKTTEFEKGMATFTDVPEATYEVHVEAPKHSGVKGVFEFKPGTSTIRIFLQRTAVTYRWTVTPTTVKDVYRISVEADFQTRVPMPVVTVTPSSFDLEEFELGFRDAFELNVTNHGLIRAQEFKFDLPQNHPSLEFKAVALFENLEARSSQIVPVKVVQKFIRRRKRATCGGYRVTIEYGYECGDWVIRKTQVTLNVAPHECTGLLAPRGNGGRGGGYIRLCCGRPASGISACNPCLQSFANCLLGFTPFSPVPCILSAANFADDVFSGNPKASDFANVAVCTGKILLTLAVPELAIPLTIYDCITGIVPACSGPPGARGSRRKRDVRDQLILNFALAAKPFSTLVQWKLEVFGKQVWLTVDDEYWMTEIFIPAVSDQSEQGEALTRKEFDMIMSGSQPVGVTKNDVSDFLTRWNNTVYDWTNGRTEPTENEPNRMSYSKIKMYKLEIKKSNDEAQAAGYDSIIDQYNDKAEAINQVTNWEEEEGVCAVVRVRIDQELTLTREGFIAKLEIDNGEISTLEEIDVNIQIRDAENGEQSTTLFAIGNATLGGGINPTRSLPMQQSGELTWLIIPYSEAAPNDDKYYDVGGILYYKVDGNLITVPLLPARITVRPDPLLFVHYFWEKFVISDDPFTDRVEGAIPFSLAVAVKNEGNGTASNLRITSSQPRIIENRKGLLITFKMIGANIGNKNVTPSLSVDFGDIDPGRTMVASWWMISSLRGMFQNYSATFENENPLGDPKLSLIDELEVHELIHRVSLGEGDVNDGITDFLVNEEIDYNINPDAVFSSNSLQRYDVTVQNISIVRVNSFATLYELILEATPSVTGFVYYRFETTIGVPELVSFNSQLFNRTVKNPLDLPPENAWFTAMIGERESEFLIGHAFDYIEDIGFRHQYFISFHNSKLRDSAITLRPTEPPIDIDLEPDVIIGRVTIPPSSQASAMGAQTLTIVCLAFLSNCMY